MPRFGQQQTAPARVAFSPGLSALPHVAQADNILQNFFVSDTLRFHLILFVFFCVEFFLFFFCVLILNLSFIL